MRQVMKSALVAAALLGACLGFGTQFAHAGDPAPQLRLPSFIEAGAVGSLTVTGFNFFTCPAGERIVVVWEPVAGGDTPVLVEIPSSQIVGGQATVQFTAPGSPGNFVTTAIRDDGDGTSCEAVSTLEVTAASTTATTTTTTTTTTAPSTTAAPTTTAGPTTSAAAIVPPTTAAQLPATGASSSSTTWMAIAALMFLVMGSALLAVRRRHG